MRAVSRYGNGTAVRTGLVVAAVSCLSASLAGSPTVETTRPMLRVQVAPPSLSPAAVAPEFIKKYCAGCHNERQRTAGLVLSSLDMSRIGSDAEVWEKVVRKLRSRAMPPPSMPRPSESEYDTFASALEATLDRASATAPNPGRPALHRLNRAEYGNAVRDLLALEVDVTSLLPTDESGYGFDNNADVLSMSPALLERYMSAARKLSGLAVGDPQVSSSQKIYRLSETLTQGDRMGEDLPFGSRGGIAVHHYFPVSGEYIFRVRMRRGLITDDVISGIQNREEIDVRIDRARVKRFSFGGDPEKLSSPEYRLHADWSLDVRVVVEAGLRTVTVAFLKKASKTEGVGPDRFPVVSASYAHDASEMSVETLEIEGPLGPTDAGDTASRRRIFGCRPKSATDEPECAKQILSTLARRAYRRSLTPQEVQNVIRAYDIARRDGRVFEEGIRFALQRILVSPHFLFRSEVDPLNAEPDSAYRLGNREIASRLSFFLWSSIPDDELLDLAARGKLNEPATIEQQVRRMLADPRAAALTKNFGDQWLHLRNMQGVFPDPRRFPEFEMNLRDALRHETELFFESQVREDRSVLELLTANYTYLNERLARHYGIPSVYGSHFRRVMLSDGRRMGLLGHGSILTVTSYSTRTSPVIRGKFLLENLLGAPPPPPPPNVPKLPEDPPTTHPTSVRARLEQHRKNPVCASCHAQMDPLGFALENYDAVGKWRTTEGSTPVDVTGRLADGTKFDGPDGLRAALLIHHEEIVHAVIEKLLTYALGRGTEYYDMPSVRKIARDSASADYRWSALILGIVKSTPFQMRRAGS